MRRHTNEQNSEEEKECDHSRNDDEEIGQLKSQNKDKNNRVRKTQLDVDKNDLKLDKIEPVEGIQKSNITEVHKFDKSKNEEDKSNDEFNSLKPMYDGDNEAMHEDSVPKATSARTKSQPHLKSENKWVDINLK